VPLGQISENKTRNMLQRVTELTKSSPSSYGGGCCWPLPEPKPSRYDNLDTSQFYKDVQNWKATKFWISSSLVLFTVGRISSLTREYAL